MKILTLAAGLLAALAVGSQFLIAAPQDEAMPPMPEAMEQHRFLAKGAGEWDAALTFTGPMGDMQMAGRESVEMFGPFFQIADFSGEFMGMDFKGRATMGYDPIRGHWTSTWTDNFSPSMQVMTGEKEGNAITFTYDGVNEMGELQPGKSVITWLTDDKHTYEAYWIDGEGNAERHMAITYTRAKADGMR